MPKMPIDFTLGQYEDVNPRLGARVNYNCYPETTAGAVNKTILRSVEGYSRLTEDVSLPASDAIFVDEVLYYVAGSNFYSSVYPYTTSTLIGSLSIAYQGEPAKLITNGKNIVILCPNGINTSDDYFYDISLATLATIESSDADYAGFGKARDVAFKDGYYVFITEQAIFHGDNVSSGTGLAFNPLSFGSLPAASGTGAGVEASNSVLYVFTSKKTFIYQTVGVTPFSFSRSTGQDIDIGLYGSLSKLSFEDQIFLIGAAAGSRPEAFVIAGTSFQQVGNDGINYEIARLATAQNQAAVSTYKIRNHRMIHIAKSPLFATMTPAYVLDLTETSIKSAPQWHIRGAWFNTNYTRSYISKYIDSSEVSPFGFGDESLYALGARDGSLGATIYRSRQEQSYPNINVFSSTLNSDNKFQYTFPFIRQSGDPVYIKSIRLRFTGNVTDVELFFSEDGELFTSLGSFDLSDVDTKTAEWRRIGRFSNDASFRVRYSTEYLISETSPDFGNKAGSLIEGYFVT